MDFIVLIYCPDSLGKWIHEQPSKPIIIFEDLLAGYKIMFDTLFLGFTNKNYASSTVSRHFGAETRKNQPKTVLFQLYYSLYRVISCIDSCIESCIDSVHNRLGLTNPMF